MCKNTQIRKDRDAEHLYFVYTVIYMIGWHAWIDRSMTVLGESHVELICACGGGSWGVCFGGVVTLAISL